MKARRSGISIDGLITAVIERRAGILSEDARPYFYPPAILFREELAAATRERAVISPPETRNGPEIS
jgi:hypothetical protein